MKLPQRKPLKVKAVSNSRGVIIAVAMDQWKALAKERLSQAHRSFNTALGFVIGASTIGFSGVILLLCGHTTAGIASLASGIVSKVTSVVLFKFNRDANDRLDKIQAQVAKVLLANIIESYSEAVHPLDNEDGEMPQSSSEEIELTRSECGSARQASKDG